MKKFNMAEAIENVRKSDLYAEAYNKTRLAICSNVVVTTNVGINLPTDKPCERHSVDKEYLWLYEYLPTPVRHIAGKMSPITRMRLRKNFIEAKNVSDPFFTTWVGGEWLDTFRFIAVYEMLALHNRLDYLNRKATIHDNVIELETGISIQIPKNSDFKLTLCHANNLAYACDAMKFYGLNDDQIKLVAEAIVNEILGIEHDKIDFKDIITKEYEKKISTSDYIETYTNLVLERDFFGPYVNKLHTPNGEYEPDIVPPLDKYDLYNLNIMKLHGYFDKINPFSDNTEQKLASVIFKLCEGKIHRIESMGNGKIVIDDGTVLTYQNSPSNISSILYVYSMLRFYKMEDDELIELCESMMD